MKTSLFKTICLLLFLVVFLSGCGKSPEPEMTATPEQTATPLPPTPTPSPEEILVDAWQAYSNQDFNTARSIAEDVRDQTKAAGNESGEALALIGLIQIDSEGSGIALYNLEKAHELGYDNEVLSNALASIYAQRIEDRSVEMHQSFDPDSILTHIHYSQENLNKLIAIDPGHSRIQEFSEIYQPTTFNPEDFTELDLPINEIENLLQLFEGDSTFNTNNTYFKELYDKYSENPIAMYVYAVQRLWTGESEEAIELLTKSIEREPYYHATWEYLGYAYESIGLLQHAREAYIHCLILNPENEYVYENLAELNNWRGYWEDTSFSNTGFSMEHNSNDVFFPLGKVSSDGGVMQSTNDFFFIQITWQPTENDHLTDDQIQVLMSKTMDAESPGFKGSYKTFDFSSAPMIYRDYSYRLPGVSTYADAVIVGCQCNDISYVFDFRFLEDGYEHEYIHYIMAIYLETFQCD